MAKSTSRSKLERPSTRPKKVAAARPALRRLLADLRSGLVDVRASATNFSGCAHSVVISPHISWLKHGSHAETALVGSVVVGRVALEGDLWTWQASLPHGDLLADHGSCETERQAKEHLEDFLKLWHEPFRPLMGATSG